MSKKLNKNKAYKQGVFSPIHPEKYRGSQPIFYRSSLELKAMRWMDGNPNILEWGSETIVIPYQSPFDGRVHRYFTDLNLKLKRKDGTTVKLLVEVKPSKFTVPPNNSKKNKKSLLYEKAMYAQNAAKWKAAKEWSTKHGYEFCILTEKHLSE
jgi:hypothetical protein